MYPLTSGSECHLNFSHILNSKSSQAGHCGHAASDIFSCSESRSYFCFNLLDCYRIYYALWKSIDLEIISPTVDPIYSRKWKQVIWCLISCDSQWGVKHSTNFHMVKIYNEMIKQNHNRLKKLMICIAFHRKKWISNISK